MRRALALAATAGVPFGPNPRVGCVLLAPDAQTVAHTVARTIAEGYHRGAGTPHAEADALARAGDAARGATAVVTLEPCNHTGRTGPCSEALVAAGVARVVYAMDDPNPVAQGGADRLREAGIEVESGLLGEEAARLNRGWLFGLAQQRPFVTWKLASTLDGYSAATDGTSRWITGAAARRDVHRLRAAHDVVLAGTGTVLADDSQLTVRDGADQPLPKAQQPLRAVMGLREIPHQARVLDDSAETVLLATRDPREALDDLFKRDKRDVLLEGGPTLAASFLKAGLVDEIVAYVAPTLLGSGRSAVGALGIDTIADALHFTTSDVAVLDGDVRITLSPGGSPVTSTKGS